MADGWVNAQRTRRGRAPKLVLIWESALGEAVGNIGFILTYVV
jgi:hypothetical protein